MRITIDGLLAEVSTKRMCNDPQKYNASSGRTNGVKEDVKSINAYLDILQNKTYNAYSLLLQGNENITAEKIKNKITGVVDRQRMIIEIFQQHNDQMNLPVKEPKQIKLVDEEFTEMQKLVQELDNCEEGKEG